MQEVSASRQGSSSHLFLRANLGQDKSPLKSPVSLFINYKGTLDFLRLKQLIFT